VRARIGLIIPSSNRLTEPHMQRYAPPGVQVHVTRLRMTGANHVALPELLPRVTEATLALADAGCDPVVFHCTASSMEAGLAGERHVLEAMRQATPGAVASTATRQATPGAVAGPATRAATPGAVASTATPPATPGAVASTATATLAALRALGLRRIALFSPYIAATHAHEAGFLAEAGVSVVGGRSLGLSGGHEYVMVPAAEWLRIAAGETPAEADGVFLSCTNIHSPEVVQPLESLLGRPVITSNQAVLWYALRVRGLRKN